jgi:uncharacterized protein (DUF58 family)
METIDLIKKIKKIEIKTKSISKNIFSGDYHSNFKGKGMAFSEVREYSFGDDIRAIDWNVSARSNSTHIKVFEEERELTVILILDMSASGNFGTLEQRKKDILIEISAILSFAAMQNNDKIGVILFTDTVEKFIPPKKGKKHILRIISELIEFKPISKKTNIKAPFEFLINTIKKRSIVFVLSDFIDDGYLDTLRIMSKRNDTILIQIYDEFEEVFPNIGLVKVKNLESDIEYLINSNDKNVNKMIKDNWEYYQNYLNDSLKKSKLDLVKIPTNKDYILPLRNLFKKREKRK